LSICQAFFGKNTTQADQAIHQDATLTEEVSVILCVAGVRRLNVVVQQGSKGDSAIVKAKTFKGINRETQIANGTGEGAVVQVVLLEGEFIVFAGDFMHGGKAAREGEQLDTFGQDGRRDVIVGETVRYILPLTATGAPRRARTRLRAARDPKTQVSDEKLGVVTRARKLRSPTENGTGFQDFYIAVRDVESNETVEVLEINVIMKSSLAFFSSLGSKKGEQVEDIEFRAIHPKHIGTTTSGDEVVHLEGHQPCMRYRNEELLDPNPPRAAALKNTFVPLATTFDFVGSMPRVVPAADCVPRFLELATRALDDDYGSEVYGPHPLNANSVGDEEAWWRWEDATVEEKEAYVAASLYQTPLAVACVPPKGTKYEASTKCEWFLHRLRRQLSHGSWFDEVMSQVLHKSIHKNSRLHRLHIQIKNLRTSKCTTDDGAAFRAGATMRSHGHDKKEYYNAYPDSNTDKFERSLTGSPQLKNIVRLMQEFKDLLEEELKFRLQFAVPIHNEKNAMPDDWVRNAMPDNWVRRFFAFSRTQGGELIVLENPGADVTSVRVLANPGFGAYEQASKSSECTPVADEVEEQRPRYVLAITCRGLYHLCPARAECTRTKQVPCNAVLQDSNGVLQDWIAVLQDSNAVLRDTIAGLQERNAVL